VRFCSVPEGILPEMRENSTTDSGWSTRKHLQDSQIESSSGSATGLAGQGVRVTTSPLTLGSYVDFRVSA
jgi:hypothetical protein